MEEWVNIEGYEGLYQVSNHGRVRTATKIVHQGLATGIIFSKVLSPKVDRYGYHLVGLYKDKKRKFFKVHRLVANHFLSEYKELPIVNHKDSNRLNNHVSNLEFCTSQYNNQHRYRNHVYKNSSKISQKAVN